MSEAAERQAIARTVQTIRKATGVTPVGWHTRSAPSVNTRRLLTEHGGFLYDSDAYCDDLPFLFFCKKLSSGERCVDTPIPHNGMLSCFFQGFSSFLLRSMARARERRLRVACGMITSSR